MSWIDHIGDVLVVGLGKTGLAVASWATSELTGRVSSVTVYGGLRASASELTRELADKGCNFIFGSEDVKGSYDLAVASPGISENSAFFKAAAAASARIIGEPELAWALSPERWIAITGTNGKTTTTSLTASLLNNAGLTAHAVGNIGTLAITSVAERAAGDWMVAELSSYQLAYAHELHPRIAALLNISPDHLSWHGSMEAYVAAKENIFAQLRPDDLAIVGPDLTELAECLTARGLRVVRLGATDPGSACAAFCSEGKLMVRLDGVEHELISVDELQILGAHNVENALAASTAALEAGAAPEAVCADLRAFKPLEHRIEPVARVAGVLYVNDSKATNVDATLQALASFEEGSLICLLGGTDKNTPLDELAAAARKACSCCICYGEAGPRLAHALRKTQLSDVREKPHLSEAFELASSLAKPGQVVLLSPACASFDEFANFEERGEYFKALVQALKEQS